MKSITKWHDECNEKQSDQDLSEEIKNYHEQLSSIDEKVANYKLEALAYSLIISSLISVIMPKIIEKFILADLSILYISSIFSSFIKIYSHFTT